MVDIRKYLTSNYSGENVRKLMQVIETEVGELNIYSNTLQDQADIESLTWGIREWEKELGIVYNPSMNIENRREIIGAKVRGVGATSKQLLINAAMAFSGGEVDILEFPEENYFIIKFVGTKGIPTNMEAFRDMLNSIKPAHLEYTFQYTFTVWGELKAKKWSELKTQTWDGVKVY